MRTASELDAMPVFIDDSPGRNMAQINAICRRLKRHWGAAFPGAWPKLEKIRIAETARNIFELGADEIE